LYAHDAVDADGGEETGESANSDVSDEISRG